jgi:hypothetical protein
MLRAGLGSFFLTAQRNASRALDIPPPRPRPGNPVTQVGAGMLLSLGAILLGERWLRRRRNRAPTAPGEQARK